MRYTNLRLLTYLLTYLGCCEGKQLSGAYLYLKTDCTDSFPLTLSISRLCTKMAKVAP